MVCRKLVFLSYRSSKLSNGETESVKTMVVHDEGESDAGSTPCKDSTLIVRQVMGPEKNQHQTFHFPFPLVALVHFLSYPK